MQQIPVDASKLQVLVVGEPVAQFKDGQARLDRETGRPLWNLEVTLIAQGRAETVRLSLPEGGFPKELGIGTFLIPEGLVVIPWKKDGGSGLMWAARSVKVVGGLAGVKAAA